MVVSYLSQFMTLIPGDLIFMGTPLGAGVQVGDLVEVEIEGIGAIENRVRKELLDRILDQIQSIGYLLIVLLSSCANAAKKIAPTTVPIPETYTPEPTSCEDVEGICLELTINLILNLRTPGSQGPGRLKNEQLKHYCDCHLSIGSLSPGR